VWVGKEEQRGVAGLVRKNVDEERGGDITILRNAHIQVSNEQLGFR
jgi:hypothetical protein